MPNLKYRQQKIQEKRKQTPWREFVKTLCSREPVGIYKNGDVKTRYPVTGREGLLVHPDNFDYGDYVALDLHERRNFFQQWKDLFEQQQKMTLSRWYDNENVEYSDSVFGAKNAYLSFNIGTESENIFYSIWSWGHISNIFNSMGVSSYSKVVYDSRIVSNSYKIFYASNIHDSNNIRFSSNLIGCIECLFCNDLQNQKYCIANKAYNKEEYYQLKDGYLRQKDAFEDRVKEYKYKNMLNYSSQNVEGGGLMKCHDVGNCFVMRDITDARNVIIGFGNPYSGRWSDCLIVGNNSFDFCAVVDAGTDSTHLYCSIGVGKSSMIFYSYFLESCSYCLGCIGLKNKQFCIFNKQYSKEERHQKVDEIFSAMDKEGTLGDFFPGWMNPFYFNDTAAYLVDDSFTKEEVEKEGYLRRDDEVSVDIPPNVSVIGTHELDEYEGWKQAESQKLKAKSNTGGLSAFSLEPSAGAKRHIDPEILKKVIRDEEGNVYKIVKMEYDFLMKHGLPLPRLHWLDRIKLGFTFK